jgi:hypothetical protein
VEYFKTKDKDEIIQNFNNKENSNEFELIKYKNYTGPAIVKHNCSFEFSVNNLKVWINNGFCPVCAESSKSLNLEVITKKIKRMYGKKYTILEENKKIEKVNSKTKLLINDNECSHPPFLNSWDKLKQGYGCQMCGNQRSDDFKRLSKKDIQEKMKKDNFFEEYKILNLDEYVNIHTKNMVVKHLTCNIERTTNLQNFLINKRGCPVCNESKAEKITESFLRKNDFEFLYNDRNLEGLKRINQLEIDFIIKRKDKDDILLEINGEFHYPWALKKNSFKTADAMVKSDEIKVKYAIDNNLEFLVIPFWEFKNIENILKDVLFNSSTTIENFDISYYKNGKIIKESRVEPSGSKSKKSLKDCDIV